MAVLQTLAVYSRPKIFVLWLILKSWRARINMFSFITFITVIVATLSMI